MDSRRPGWVPSAAALHRDTECFHPEILMPRAAMAVPFIALLALTLTSCFDDVNDCGTCPPVHSGVIKIAVTPNGLVDSVQVRMDGGAQVTIKRNHEADFTSLSTGTHQVQTVRWFNEFGIPNSRSQTIHIQLAQGETRTIQFHNDFPLVTWAGTPRFRAPAGHAPAVG
jgi:hypothetical protein